MKQPSNAVDQKKLERFAKRVRGEAAKTFKSKEGQTLVDIDFIDRSRYNPKHEIPIPYAHYIETEKEWRDAIDLMICNASTALDILSRNFRAYQGEKACLDRLFGLKTLLDKLAKDQGYTILCSIDGTIPSLVQKGLKWICVGASTNMDWGHNWLPNISDSSYEDNSLLFHVTKKIDELKTRFGSSLDLFLVTSDRELNLRVYAAVSADRQFKPKASN